MQFEPNQIYHVYNRGNNKQQIFFNRENYLYFLRKVRKELLPHCEILAYCLMPNHFHFLIYANDNTGAPHIVKEKGLTLTKFGNGIKTLLSSYTRAINNQEKRINSLFKQKTEAKLVSSDFAQLDYSVYCMHYIHQNPTKAGLVTQMKDWEFSSFQDYTGLRGGTLCNQSLARKILWLDWNNWLFESDKDINDDMIKNLF
jgi:REP element-mobilizing transposase RayT